MTVACCACLHTSASIFLLVGPVFVVGYFLFVIIPVSVTYLCLLHTCILKFEDLSLTTLSLNTIIADPL